MLRQTPRRNNRRRQRRSRTAPYTKVNAQLDQLIQYESSQTLASQPAVIDVPYPRLNPNQVYTFERSWQIGTVQLSNAPLDTFGSVFTQLDDLPGYTEFTALFDLYRFEKLQVDFIPTQQTSYSGNLITCIDYNDASVPVSIANLMQYQTAQQNAAGSTVRRVFTPRIDLAAYSGSAFTSYATAALQWIDTASPDVIHYGIKWGVQGVVAQISSDVKWIINAKAIVQFKNPK